MSDEQAEQFWEVGKCEGELEADGKTSQKLRELERQGWQKYQETKPDKEGFYLVWVEYTGNDLHRLRKWVDLRWYSTDGSGFGEEREGGVMTYTADKYITHWQAITPPD